MYGLDKNIDLNFFIGKQLIQLCLGQFEFILTFDEKVSISINAGFTFSTVRYASQEKSHKAYILHVLVGKKVVAASHGKEPGDLILKFEEDNVLILHDDFEQYESYTFWSPKGLVVV